MLIQKGKAMVRSFRKPKQYLKKKRVCWPLEYNVAKKRWGKATDQMAIAITIERMKWKVFSSILNEWVLTFGFEFLDAWNFFVWCIYSLFFYVTW